MVLLRGGNFLQENLLHWIGVIVRISLNYQIGLHPQNCKTPKGNASVAKERKQLLRIVFVLLNKSYG